MKKTLKIFALGLLSAALFSCQDADLQVIENMIYITDAATGKVGTVTMAEGDNLINFTVRMAKAVDEDTRVAIVIDENILKEYNETYQSSFNHVSAENIEIPALAVIPAGSVSSDPITIKVKEFDTMGAQYAISFKITSSGNVPVAEASSKYIIQLMKPLKQLVPKFEWKNAMQCQPIEEPWGYELMNYTLEWWVRMTGLYSVDGGFSINNQAIINSGGQDCELYIRFGDEIYGYGWYQYLQIKTMGSQFDTGDPNEGYGLTSGQWYHFAISYDGSTGDSIMYKDGQVVATLNTGAGRPMIIDRFQMCSSGSRYFPNYAEMCQVRLWKTTRSETQIQKNMRSEVEYSNKDLIMYLPMSEGEGSLLHDVTGNGHDVYIGSLPGVGSRTDAVAWTEYAF